MIKNRVFQHFVQQPESFMTHDVDSAIFHVNIDLIPGCWNFSFKTGGVEAGNSNRFFRFVWLNAGGVRDVPWYEMYPALRSAIYSIQQNICWLRSK